MLDPALEADGIGPSPFSEALAEDWAARRDDLAAQLGGARVLVVGAAGTIGAAAVRQLLPLAPARLELVDIDENGLARLARDIRSRGEGGRTEIGFNALDFAGPPGLALAQAFGPFDLVLNFAAVKHVRSEKNLFTLLHMIDVNIVRQQCFAAHLAGHGLAARHFIVSTDKAADPASFMGATKLMLEAAVFAASAGAVRASAARFANVAYSSGSLLESYLQRFAAGQALAAPADTRRYFVAARDAARICLLAQLACPPARIAIPRFEPGAGAVGLADTAARFLAGRGRRAVFVDSNDAAAELLGRAGPDYPVLLTPRDTAGEKEIEVFRGEGEGAESLGLASLEAVIPAPIDAAALQSALDDLAAFVAGARTATLDQIEATVRGVLPAFRHISAQARLDDRI
ncbi:MAG TPA: polysaccharide biosynthesis protein [Caulobacteraceae bacterium]|nr:polysaccharide biosynthesis protein [Caulobacteraceae bacterium]